MVVCCLEQKKNIVFNWSRQQRIIPVGPHVEWKVDCVRQQATTMSTIRRRSSEDSQGKLAQKWSLFTGQLLTRSYESRRNHNM